MAGRTFSATPVTSGKAPDELDELATGEPVAAVEARYDGGGYGRFKEEVADAVVALLEPIQERYARLRSDPGELQRLLAVGAEKARANSEPTLRTMYERMGFVTPVRGTGADGAA